MRSILVMGILASLLALLGCDRDREKPDLPEWTNNPRKVKTETELAKLGIPINRWLPPVETEGEARIRDPKEVAVRAVVLYAVVAVGQGGDRRSIKEFIKTEGLWEAVTPNERLLFGKEVPPKQALVDASWRAEALWVLLWALGKVETLDLPGGQCDASLFQRVMPAKEDVEGFINTATLRPKSLILDETDRIYRIHWALREAKITGTPVPAGLNPDVVVERHYALNWLTWYADQWDDVTTDT